MMASCAVLPGTVADGLLSRPTESPATINIEHPSGSIEVIVDFAVNRDNFDIKSAGLVRTARKLATGHVFAR